MIRSPPNQLCQPPPSLEFSPPAEEKDDPRWMASIEFVFPFQSFSRQPQILVQFYRNPTRDSYACAYPRDRIRVREFPRHLLLRATAIAITTPTWRLRLSSDPWKYFRVHVSQQSKRYMSFLYCFMSIFSSHCPDHLSNLPDSKWFGKKCLFF